MWLQLFTSSMKTSPNSKLCIDKSRSRRKENLEQELEKKNKTLFPRPEIRNWQLIK